MSLRRRLSLLFALGTAAVVAAAGLAFVWQLRYSANAALDDTLQARARTLAAQVAAARPLAAADAGGGGQNGPRGGFFGGDEAGSFEGVGGVWGGVRRLGARGGARRATGTLS